MTSAATAAAPASAPPVPFAVRPRSAPAKPTQSSAEPDENVAAVKPRSRSPHGDRTRGAEKKDSGSFQDLVESIAAGDDDNTSETVSQGTQKPKTGDTRRTLTAWNTTSDAFASLPPRGIGDKDDTSDTDQEGRRESPDKARTGNAGQSASRRKATRAHCAGTCDRANTAGSARSEPCKRTRNRRTGERRNRDESS